MTYLFLFIFGLAIGSFLNVVSLRFQPGQRLLDLRIINGRSHCPHCQKTLRWYELIPLLSFIVQFGKCRHCKKKLSLQYPLVEFLSGLIFVSVPLLLTNFQFSPPAGGFNLSILQLIIIAVWLLIFILFLLLSVIDFRHYIIPDSINLSLAALGIILIIFNQILDSKFQILNSGSFLGHYALLFDFWPLSNVSGQLSAVSSHLFAAIIAMAFFAAIIILTRGRAMGWGDFKLVGALGLIFGWPDILMIVFLSFIVGAICVTPLLIRKQKTMKDAVPFGPFLIAGSALIFFFGYNIIDGYFKLFGL